MSKIKICGLRRKEDIQYANRCLPDYIGFVFAPSRRQVDADAAAELKELLDPRVRAVGVFVNQEIALIASLCRQGIIDLVQLHGDEDETYITALREATAAPIIQAVPIGTAQSPGTTAPATTSVTDASATSTIAPANTTSVCAAPPSAATITTSAVTIIEAAASADFLLFDAAQTGLRGGGGQPFDWRILREIRRHIRQPFFLAGGLNPDNLAEAIRLLNPYGVDLSSGVETDGWKDFEKMSAAVRIARES
jgi:phosphoribosylanthranilate isomerase